MQPLRAPPLAVAAFVLGSCGGRIPISEGEPSAYGPYDVYLVLAWSSASTDGPVEGFAMASATSVEIRYPGPDDVEGCWLTNGVELQGIPTDVGATIGLEIGGTTAELAHEGDSDPYYYLYAEGDLAAALSAPGQEVHIESTPTGMLTPDRLAGASMVTVDDILLDLHWEPPETEQAGQFVLGHLELPSQQNVLCALDDDGEARVDLGELGSDPIGLTLHRVVLGLPNVDGVGTVYTGLFTSIEVDR